MAYRPDSDIKPFEKKIWLSSPTMHGDGLKYMQEAYETKLIKRTDEGTIIVYECDNLFRANMMNIKDIYKNNPNPGIYDRNYDSYCSLVSFDDFFNNPNYYINIACEKRDTLYKYKIRRNLF